MGSAKLFIGLSDITSLHVFLNQNWGWPTVHGPLLDRLGRKATLPKYEKEMHHFVFGDLPEIRFKGLRPLNEAARKTGRRVRGAVSGGNMVVLQSSLGSNASWETTGRILFFEDTGERGYRIDRMLSQFSQAGLFAHCKAIVFGQFIGGEEADGSSLIQPVIRRFAQSMKIPVLGGLQSGHDLIQRPLPFETKAILKLGDRGELICDSGVATEA
jgi:muramoyltetrapeptide carboxypeptidase